MRIATYNVNSIRSRVGRIVDWMVREDVDVVAMQEIKCTEAQFPFDAVRGGRVRGRPARSQPVERRRHREPLNRFRMSQVGFDGMPGFAKGQEGPDQPLEARAIGATVGGIRIWSLYVPNGRALGDPHYAYKLDWLAALAALDRASGWRPTPTSRSR